MSSLNHLNVQKTHLFIQILMLSIQLAWICCIFIYLPQGFQGDNVLHMNSRWTQFSCRSGDYFCCLISVFLHWSTPQPVPVDSNIHISKKKEVEAARITALLIGGLPAVFTHYCTCLSSVLVTRGPAGGCRCLCSHMKHFWNTPRKFQGCGAPVLEERGAAVTRASIED